MKFQDIIFVVCLLVLLYKKNNKLAVVSGLICLTISIPLFAKWIFFTAERLTWYAAGFFCLSLLITLINNFFKRSTISK